MKQGSGLEQRQDTTLTAPPTTLTTTLRLTEAQHEILKIIESFPSVSASELVVKVGNITLDGVKYNLKALQQKGILKRVGPKFGGHWEVIKFQSQDGSSEEVK